MRDLRASLQRLVSLLKLLLKLLPLLLTNKDTHNLLFCSLKSVLESVCNYKFKNFTKIFFDKFVIIIHTYFLALEKMLSPDHHLPSYLT